MESEAYAALAHQEDHHWWFAGRRRILTDLLRAHLKPRDGRRILDVGCGTGGMFQMLKPLGHVEGADGSQEAIGYATSRHPDVTIHEVRLPDALPGADWDLITAFDVVEHLDEPVASLAAMRDRLAPDGQVVVTVPAYDFLSSHHDVVHHHKRRYRRALLVEQLRAAGLRPTYTTHFNTWLLPAIASVRLAGRLLKVGNGHARGDLRDTPGPLNAALTWLFASERMALRVAPLPAGVSIFAIAERG
ncbi:MAG TPA: class I SAM-dependent methyltransferase [Kofleriaceae bacterium]|jgi:2-polyprenyl-3-methyl-5-hydroxy-6-metoxy-1,4-benzoquinol methylase